MADATPPQSSPSRRARSLSLHVLSLIGLFAVGIGVATIHGALWPFDLRFSALITAGGIALLAVAWWPAAVAIGLVAALLSRPLWRLLLWPPAVLAMVALHAGFGPHLGFISLRDLGPLGALRLYAIPVALSILIGSLLRETFRPRRAGNAAPVTGAPVFRERKAP